MTTMSDDATDSAASQASENDQRLQSQTLQHLDLMLGHSELNEFRKRMQVNQHRDKLVHRCQKLLQSICEKENFLRYVYEALAKDRAEFDATKKEIEKLEQLELDPSDLDSMLARNPLVETPSDNTPRDEDGDSSEGKESFCNHARLPLSPGSAKTLPDLPPMTSIFTTSKADKGALLHSRAIILRTVAWGDQQIHRSKVWQRSPGAAVTMPDLPMLNANSQDPDTGVDSALQGGDKDLSSSMDLYHLAHQINRQLPSAVKTMPDLPPLPKTVASDGTLSPCVSASVRKQPSGAAVSMPDLPLMTDNIEDSSNDKECSPFCSQNDDAEHVSGSMDLSCLVEKIGQGASHTMPDLPQMNTIDDILNPSRAAVAGNAPHEETQGHCIRAWHRPPGAAITMPDLPMMTEEEDDASDMEECLEQEPSQDIQASHFTQADLLPSLGMLQDKTPTGIGGGIGAQFQWHYASRLRQVLSVPSLSQEGSHHSVTLGSCSVTTSRLKGPEGLDSHI
mmetsp:Transcript_43553/g.81842  ORF Transcript_43553/g.81842 Transcript_43553/m.81842 type:complete len:507 (+) Transcript_43553:45-1565(+)